MYKFKTSEQNNDKATEFETKSLLYLLTKIKGHSGISLFIIDCFNDVTGVVFCRTGSAQSIQYRE